MNWIDLIRGEGRRHFLFQFETAKKESQINNLLISNSTFRIALKFEYSKMSKWARGGGFITHTGIIPAVTTCAIVSSAAEEDDSKVTNQWSLSIINGS